VYADVSLPVPLDQPFTYLLPETLRHRVKPGCRVIVPFGSRKLTGIVLLVHDQAPSAQARQVFQLLDEDPVIEDHLIALGQWIASYYCAPLGEVLRVMAPLGGEIKTAKIFSLTDTGRDTARQLSIVPAGEDVSTQVLQLLEQRPRSAAYIKKKLPESARALQSLLKKGLIESESVQSERDPMRAASTRLRISSIAGVTVAGKKLKKAERELLSYLDLHPGSHNLLEAEEKVKNASQAARSLARLGLLQMELEPIAMGSYPVKPRPQMNAHQAAAFAAIKMALDDGQFQAFLLQGVTGSGKTEVYLNAIEATLAAGRNALLLVPEIALTPAVAGQFFHRFGDSVAILHSAFHDAERAEQWRRIRSGKARVVVGTRSGVFAPVQNLGLIIVDEEHDGSYKQQDTPRYHGRDVAVVRARDAGACILLGSATPSMESKYNVERGKYKQLDLPQRVENRPMPTVVLIDMRDEFIETKAQNTFSRRLLDGIKERLESQEQVMLLHNRRGFSTFAACRSCGERMQCVNCALTLTYHRRDRRMLCHYCGYAAGVPTQCPKCASEHMYFLGVGSEKVEEELHRAFPSARIARMDRDSVSGKRQFETILSGFRDRDYDILVGTQMIAKGHDIHNVTLVGVISADIGLGMPDFRAAERTFQLLTQVSGRAGRGDLPGEVLIQTINPDHYAVRLASLQDFAGFYKTEMHFRSSMRYPPFSALANIVLRSEKQEEALRMSAEISHLLTPPPKNFRVLGPAEAPVPRLKKEYRYQLLVKAADRRELNSTLHRLRLYALDKKWNATALMIDVDPLTLM
jgi:primosomal protein N' (replication factor Y)